MKLRGVINLLKKNNKSHHDVSHLTTIFTRLMFQGKVRSAVRWLSEYGKGSALQLNDTIDLKGEDGTVVQSSVLDALHSKHPPPVVPPKSALLDSDVLPPFEDVEITGGLINKIANMIQGSGGPGGSDAAHWQDALLRYGSHSAKLRDQVASVARRSIVPWCDVRSLVACQLVALDKCPGVQPIGIGETLRRIIGKAICLVTGPDIEDVCGADQLCAGVQAGIKGAVHVINDLSQERCDDEWGVLMMDASNTFNNINRMAVLWNARLLWPRCSRFIFNTYRGWAPLVVRSASSFLYSKEGVTQGDPLSMFIYAIGVLPLIKEVGHPSRGGTQVWYAYGTSACADLEALKDWLTRLLTEGPVYGYSPKPSKSYIVVNVRSVERANTIFGPLGVNVVTSHRFLGGVVGDRDGRNEFLRSQVDGWSDILDHLSEQPQAAYAALTKSIQNKWQFVQRLVPNCKQALAVIEHKLCSSVLPSIFGCEISSQERCIFSLPTRFGGLHVLNPTECCEFLYSTSRKTTAVITLSLKEHSTFYSSEHSDVVAQVQAAILKEKEIDFEERFLSIVAHLNSEQRRSVQRAKDAKISSWLNVLPVVRYNFDMSATEFRDALAIRYRKLLLNIPSDCDGYGATLSLSHALSCRKGGLVIQRHNEIRDAFGDLATLVWNQVRREPVVREPDSSCSSPALVADLAVRGVWSPQVDVLLDIRVTDTDASSYMLIRHLWLY